MGFEPKRIKKTDLCIFFLCSQDIIENSLWRKKTTTQPFLFQGEETEYDSDNSSTGIHNKNHVSLRRPRADTMPTQSTSFPYNTDYHNMPFGSGVFDHLNDGLTSPTTPTTDQLLKGDNNNTIASTFASLGLNDDHTPPSSSSSHLFQPRHVIHASHSYSSLQALSENQQQHEMTDWNTNYYGNQDLRSSVTNLRFQHQQRPRALSSAEQEQEQQQQTIPRSIWYSTSNQENTRQFNKPFLRSSNSSADLLEMIARQRKANANTSNNSPIIEDMQSIDGVWATGVEKRYKKNVLPLFYFY